MPTITPTSNRLDRLEPGREYTALITDAKVVAGKFKEQVEITMLVDVAGEQIEIRDWCNLSLNRTKDGVPSGLLRLLNAIADRDSPAEPVAEFSTDPPCAWRYPDEAEAGHALVGSEVRIQVVRQPRRDGKGEWTSIRSYASAAEPPL